MKRTIVASALFAMFAVPTVALATTGYFPHGYGMKAKGMGGAATAMAIDSFGGANNPASMVWAGSRFDVGLDLFSPRRDIARTGSFASSGGFASIDGAVNSDSNLFFIPEFGYNRMLGWDMSVGLSVYGNGGMNTDYDGGQIPAASPVCGTGAGGFNAASGQAGPYNLLCGEGRLTMNLEQLIIAPTFAKKINKNHSLGASLLIARQAFHMEGLSAFYSYTSAPYLPGTSFAANNNLTNRGKDSNWGYGLKLGWMGKVSDTVTLGASYTSKMKMGKFDKYKDLFAGEGYFDIPEHFELGVAFKASPKWTIAADYQRINLAGIKSVNNPSRTALDGVPPTFGIPNTLGCDTCRGFGWQSINVFKLGAEYQYKPNLILRAGYTHNDNPIRGDDVTFNMIAPGVVQDHVTLGFTYSLNKDAELTMSYMHAFTNSVEAPSLFNAFGVPASTEKIRMYQNSLGIAYSMKLK